jgi:hypothetical protein
MPSTERLFRLESLALLEKEVVFGAAAASYVVTISVVVWLVGDIAVLGQSGILRHHGGIGDIL